MMDKNQQDSRDNIKVSVIVCAYNEEKCVAETINDLLACPTAQEIIVVNDGSTDHTRTILRGFGNKIRLISYYKNRGKGFALSRGIKAARGEIVVFIDADIRNIKDNHIKQLVQPILKRKTNYVLGRCLPGQVQGSMLLPFTGQRAYLKQILIPHLYRLSKTRYGAETYLNGIFKIRWGKKVNLVGVEHIMKYQKMPLAEVLPSHLQEIIEISKAKLEIAASQHEQLRKLLNPKKIKTLKALREKLNKIKDKEISELIQTYILPYLKKISK